MKKAIRIVAMIFILFVIGFFIDKAICYAHIPDKPYIEGSVKYKEIVYLQNNEIQFIDDKGEKGEAFKIYVPTKRKVFGYTVPIYKRLQTMGVVNITWGNVDYPIGFTYVYGYPNVAYPVLLNNKNEMLICSRETGPNTHWTNPIEVTDGGRILINLEGNNKNYLVFYDMEECKEENILYEGENIRYFALSRNGLLAVNEEIDSDLMLNIYDEHSKLIYSNNDNDYYEFFAWSSDGNKLLFPGKNDNGVIDKIQIINFLTGDTQIINQEVFYASFSPSGDKLVMDTKNGIVILDLLTMEEKIISQGDSPHWHP
jgi:hypothetical protein